MADEEKQLEQVKKVLGLEQDSLDTANKKLEVAKQLLDTAKQEGAEKAKQHAAYDAHQQAKIAVQKALLKELQEQEEQNAKAIADKIVEIDQLENQLGIVQKLRGETKGLVEGLTGMSNKWKDSFVGGILDPLTSAEDKLTGIMQGLEESVTISNLLGSSFQKVGELMAASFFELQSALPAFNAATGQAGAMNDQIMAVADSSRRFGVGMDEAQASMNSLMTGMGNFNLLTDTAQNRLATFTVGLERLGVDTATSTSLFNNLTNALGYGVTQMEDVTYALMSTAHALKVPVAELIKGFDQAMPRLAMYGKGAIDVFKKLAAQSKATGIETGKLIGIVSQFDTFEGAATAAGRLNAMLGGAYLNSVELMRASDEKRVILLRRSLEMSGKTWEAMNRQMKQAYASAAGINDMDDAAKLFTSSLTDLQNGFGEASVEQENFNQMVSQSTKLSEKFSQFWMKAIAPMVPTIQKVIESLTAFLDRLMALPGAWSAAIAAGSLILGIFVSLKVVSYLLGTAIGWVAGSASAATPAITALGAAATAATPLVTALGFSTTTLVPVMALITVSILAVAAAIGVLVWGVTRIVQAFTNLVTVMFQNKDAFAPFAAALMQVAAASLMVGNPIAMAGLLALTAGVVGIGLAMHALPLAKLQEFNEMMSTATNAAKAGVTIKGKVGLAKAEITAVGAGTAAATSAGTNNQQFKVEVIVNGTDELSRALKNAMSAEIKKLKP